MDYRFSSVHSLSLQNDATVIPPSFDNRVPSLDSDECDPTSIPVMESFDMKKFSGSWFELSKSASGYIDVNDGMWRIQTANNSSTFLFSGRDSNAHCIRPIKGKIHASDQPPGLLTLHYKTYSNHVEETIRVLFTDYTSIAVIYKCVHHIHREKEVCHSAGLLGAIWTRLPHVDRHVYEIGISYLEMACVHRSVLVIRNVIGPCKVDDVGFRIDDFPVPDFCYQPMDLGSCRGDFQRYYYNQQTRNCETFSFSGCGGNMNNFMSLAECQDKCLSNSKEPVCMSVAKCAIHCAPCCAKDRSSCVECTCEDVIEDNFLNCVKNPGFCQPECEVEEFFVGCYICSCNSENEPFIDDDKYLTRVCIEVKREGNCDEKNERYYYNVLTDTCEAFIYTGCDGNKNNFETLHECFEKCKPDDIFKSEIKEGGDSAEKIQHQLWITGLLLFIMLSHTFL